MLLLKDRINNLITDFTLKCQITNKDNKILLLISIIIVGIVQSQLLFTYFFRDDFLHIYQIANWPALEFIFSAYGGHLYITRNLIFLIMFKFFGMNAFYYFLIVLITHLASVFLLFKIIRLLTGNNVIAFTGSVIWGMSPVNYATLAWYSAYGHIIVGPFFLLFLYDLFRIEKGIITFNLKIALKWSLYFFIMATSFGTGLAIIVVSPVIILILLWKHKNKWILALSTIPIIIFVLFLLYFNNRIFFLITGHDQEIARAFIGLLPNTFSIITEMFIKMSIYAIYCMSGFPFLYFLSLIKYPIIAYFIAIPVFLLLCILFRKTNFIRRRYYFIFIFYVTAFIGLTAYARAPVYHTLGISITDASISPRYFYIIFIMIILILSLMVQQIVTKKILNKKVILILFVILAISIPFSIKSARRSDITNTHKKEKKLYYSTLKQIKKEIKDVPEGSDVYLDNTLKGNFSIFLPTETDFPGRAAVYAIAFPDNIAYGRRIYFVEKDKKIIESNIRKSEWRISKLLISKSEAENRKL